MKVNSEKIEFYEKNLDRINFGYNLQKPKMPLLLLLLLQFLL